MVDCPAKGASTVDEGGPAHVEQVATTADSLRIGLFESPVNGLPELPFWGA